MGIYGLEKTNNKSNKKEIMIDVRETKSVYVLCIYKNNIKLEHKLVKAKFISEPYKCIFNYMRKDFILNGNSKEEVTVYRMVNDKKEIICIVSNSVIQSVIEQNEFLDSIENTMKNHTEPDKESKIDNNIIDINIVKNKTEYKIAIKDTKKYNRVALNRFEYIPYRCISKSLYKLGIQLDNYIVRFNNINLFSITGHDITILHKEDELLSMIPVNIKSDKITNSNITDTAENTDIYDCKSLYPSEMPVTDYEQSDDITNDSDYDNMIPSLNIKINKDDCRDLFTDKKEDNTNMYLSHQIANVCIVPLENLNVEYMKLLIEEYDKKERTISINDFYLSNEFQGKVKEIQMIINRFGFAQHLYSNYNPFNNLNQIDKE